MTRRFEVKTCHIINTSVIGTQSNHIIYGASYHKYEKLLSGESFVFTPSPCKNWDVKFFPCRALSNRSKITFRIL